MFNEPAVLYCCITAKFGKTKNGLLKYVSCSCWTHLRETFHIIKALQLTKRTTAPNVKIRR